MTGPKRTRGPKEHSFEPLAALLSFASYFDFFGRSISASAEITAPRTMIATCFHMSVSLVVGLPGKQHRRCLLVEHIHVPCGDHFIAPRGQRGRVDIDRDPEHGDAELGSALA